MKKLWSFTKALKPVKGIVSKPNMHPNFFAEYNGKLYFTLVNMGGDATLIYELDPVKQDGASVFEVGGIANVAPIMDGKIYFFRDYYYRCFDLQSKSLVFEYSLDYVKGDFSNGPMYIGNEVYFGAIGGFYCADKETGNQKWVLELGNTGTQFFLCSENFMGTIYNFITNKF